MSDILIKNVEMPKDCYVCHSSMGFRFPSCPLNSGPDTACLLAGRHPNCPLEEFNGSDWYTGTPIEKGDYLVWAKFRKGDNYDYASSMLYEWNGVNWQINKYFPIENERIIAWKKIKPYRGNEE